MTTSHKKSWRRFPRERRSTWCLTARRVKTVLGVGHSKFDKAVLEGSVAFSRDSWYLAL